MILLLLLLIPSCVVCGLLSFRSPPRATTLPAPPVVAQATLVTEGRHTEEDRSPPAYSECHV